MDREEAMKLFDERFGELLSPELFRRLVVYFGSMGVIKQRADAAVIADAEEALRSMDFLDDYLQLVLQQARDEDSILGREIYQSFTEPKIERFAAALQGHGLISTPG